jgi:uncharacterized protein YceK
MMRLTEKKPPRHIEPDILLAAVLLYLSAIAFTIIRGADSFIVGLLSGCASITTGVWMGLIISHQRGYTPEYAVKLKDMDDTDETSVDYEDDDEDWGDLKPPR